MFFLKRNLLFVFLVVLVVVLIIFKVISGNDKTNTTEISNKITPTLTKINSDLNQTLKTKYPTIEEKDPTDVNLIDISPDYPLKYLLPYTTKDFIVEEYSAPMTLKVKVLIPSIDQAQQEVNNWIIKNGLEAEKHHLILMN
ncbi:MAG: hypothetical protein WCG91_04440 [Candidatus Shapirobacteria bacterium]